MPATPHPLSLAPDALAALEREIDDVVAVWRADAASAPVFPADPGAAAGLARPLPEAPSPSWSADLRAIAAACRRNDSPRFWAYVMGAGSDVGALGAYLGAVLNQNVTAWRSAPSATDVEHTTVRWLADLVGYRPRAPAPAPGGASPPSPAPGTGTTAGPAPDRGGGFFVSGGSTANLAGLAMARAARLPDVGRRGLRAAPPVAVYASAEAHLSIGKACDLLGFGRDALRALPVDRDFRLRPDALDDAVARDRAAGVLPLAAVASAGTVNTGAVDPLAAVAAACRRHGLWLHVDGAYGALAAAARPDLFPGLAEADSLSLDAHKWLGAPLDASCLLYRDERPALAAFRYDADYTKTGDGGGPQDFAFFDRSPELSRPFRALKVWLMLSVFGAAAFRQAIARNIDRAHELAARLAAAPDFELLAPTALSVCCFRHVPAGARRAPAVDAAASTGAMAAAAASPASGPTGGPAAPPGAADAALDALNRRLLDEVVRRGRVYLSGTLVNGRFALRTCMTHPATSSADLDLLLAELRAAAVTAPPGGP